MKLVTTPALRFGKYKSYEALRNTRPTIALCLGMIRRYWHLPEREAIYWLEGSLSPMPGSYPFRVWRDNVDCCHYKADTPGYCSILQCRGLDQPLRRLGVAVDEKSKLIHVRLVYQEAEW